MNARLRCLALTLAGKEGAKGQPTPMPRSPQDVAIVRHLIEQIPTWPETGGDQRVQYNREGRVRRLDFSRLDLRTLGSEVGQLTTLRELRLDHNQLTQVPKELGHLSQLRHLQLNNNHLTCLPAALSSLSWLRRLRLDTNHLTHLPTQFGQLRALYWLALENNPDLQTPPPDVVVAGTQAVLAYLRTHESQR